MLFCLGLLSKSAFAQNNNGTIDAAGDIAFVAYATNPTNNITGFAFVLLDDCTNTTPIGFTDNSWNSSGAFASSEGEIVWTNTTGATISKGTVIKFAGAVGNSVTLWTISNTSVNIGSFTLSGSFSTANGDQVFAYTGTRASPGTHLAFVGGITTSTLCFQGSPYGSGCNSGTPSALVFNGAKAVNVQTGSRYTGATLCNGTLTACNTMVNTAGSWGTTGFTGIATQAAFFAAIPNTFTGTALPVELTAFHATRTGSSNLLTWQTASESQNKGFDIERSEDGSRFEKTGFVAGKGTTTQTQNYTFTDLRPNQGVSYYRLKQLDFDGQFEYSKIVSVKQNGKNIVSVFPNPNKGMFTITGVEDTENKTFVLMNSVGQTFSITVQNDGQINMSAYPSGVYYLHIVSTSSGQIMKLVKE